MGDQFFELGKRGFIICPHGIKREYTIHASSMVRLLALTPVARMELSDRCGGIINDCDLNQIELLSRLSV
jgi:hypothetical protein